MIGLIEIAKLVLQLIAVLMLMAGIGVWSILFADYESSDAPTCTRVQVVSFLDPCRSLP